LVEHVTENHGVGSSILPLGTIFTNNLEPQRVAALFGGHIGVTAHQALVSTTPQPHDAIGMQESDGQWNIYRMEDDKSFTLLEDAYTDEHKAAERVRALGPVGLGDQSMT
jgi:hypothetical protein